MPVQVEIPPHINKIKLMVAALATSGVLREYLPDNEVQDVLDIHQHFLTYTQEKLERDLARYNKFSKYYQNIRRLVIWRMRKKGLTYVSIGEIIGVTPARIRAICEREERIERRNTK
jgi:uncharacterized membrane protein